MAIRGTYKGPKEVPLDITFIKSSQTVVMTTMEEIYFAQEGVVGISLKKSCGWSTTGQNIEQGLIEKQAAICAGCINYDAVVGTIDGLLVRFKGFNVFEAKVAHNGSCTCLFNRKDESGIITGGADAKIIFWDTNLNKQRVLDISTFKGDLPLLNPRVRALYESDDHQKLIVGTRSGCILEIDKDNQMKLIHAAHSDNELWGLTSVPNKEEVITCAGDCLVILWDTKKKKSRRFHKLDYTASCCDVALDCSLVAVGCSNGYLIVFDYETFSIVKFKKKDRFKEINVVKFSPNKEYLAVGATDNQIFLYTTRNWQRVGGLSGHRSAVIKIDWSLDSKFIHSNGYHVENLFFDVEARTEVKNGGDLTKNAKWATWTCLFGWQTIGIWPANSTGMEINATCRSPDSRLLVTGDDYGRLKIFKYPCYIKNASHFNIAGHANHISNVCFSSKGDKLYSVGLKDNTLMQWRIVQRKQDDSKPVDISQFKDDDLEQVKKGVLETEVLAQALQLSDIAPKQLGLFDLAMLEVGDQMLAEKPFKKQAEQSIPDGYKPSTKSKDPPEGNLYMRHIFSYRSFDCKGNLFFLDSSELCVFSAASVAVVMNTETKAQKFFSNHQDDLVSMDMSRDRRYCATGSVCSKNNSTETDFFVWDTSSMMEAGRVSDFHGGSVKLLRFAPDSTFIASVGRDEPHKLAIHDWKDNRLLCSATVDHHSVFDIDWLDRTYLVTVGKCHIKFWSINLKNLTSLNGAWGEFKPEPLICARYGKDVCYTGSGKGNIGIWVNCVKKANCKAHEGTVFCLFYDSKTENLISGGKDGMVKVWKPNGETLTMFNCIFDANKMGDPDKEFNAVRSIDKHADGSFLFGCRNAKIIKLYSDNIKTEVVMDGHFDGSLKALAVHPSKPLIVTGGEDKTLRLWDALKRSLEKKIWLEREIVTLDWNSKGDRIIAGTSQNELLLYDSNLNRMFVGLSHFSKKKDMTLSKVKFNADSTKLAVAANGICGDLEILEVTEDDKIKRLVVIHVDQHGGLINFDWSTDSHYIIANTDSHEIKFVNIDSQELVRPADAKNIDWYTWTCVFGFATLGVFPNILGEDVSAVCRATGREVMATGDDLQQVNIYRYPAVQKKSGRKKYTAHSASVSELRFFLEDHALVSIGGKDKSIVIWSTDLGNDSEHKEDWLHGTGISYDP